MSHSLSLPLILATAVVRIALGARIHFVLTAPASGALRLSDARSFPTLREPVCNGSPREILNQWAYLSSSRWTIIEGALRASQRHLLPTPETFKTLPNIRCSPSLYYSPCSLASVSQNYLPNKLPAYKCLSQPLISCTQTKTRAVLKP